MTANPNWTAEEAQAATEAALAANPQRSLSDPTLPIFQWVALRTLDGLHGQFKAGDRGALLAAIRRCAHHDLPLPAWAATAYIKAYDAVRTCRVKSWDAAFGPPFAKGVHLHAERKRWLLGPQVWVAVKDILSREFDTAIDAALFARVGKQVRPPIGRTEAEKLYYETSRVVGKAKRLR